MSALIATVTAPRGDLSSRLTSRRSAAWWLRTAVSLALAVAILAIALPTAFGAGVWGGGVDANRFFSDATSQPARSASPQAPAAHDFQTP